MMRLLVLVTGSNRSFGGSILTAGGKYRRDGAEQDGRTRVVGMG